MLVGISGKKQSGKNTIAKIWQCLDWFYNHNEKNIQEKYWKENPIDADIQFVIKVIDKSIIFTNWKQKSFASKLKQILCILTGCTIEQLEDESFKNSKLPEEWKVWRVSKYLDDTYNIDNSFLLFNNRDEALQFMYDNDRNSNTVLYGPIEYLPTYREALQNMGTELFREQFHPNVWINALFAEYKPELRNSTSKEEYSEDKELCYDKPVYPNWLITDVRFENEVDAITARVGTLIRIDKNNYNTGNHASETALDNSKCFDYYLKYGSIEELIIQVKNVMIKEGVINEVDFPQGLRHYANFHGFLYKDKKFYKPYTDEILTIDEMYSKFNKTKK